MTNEQGTEMTDWDYYDEEPPETAADREFIDWLEAGQPW